MLRQSFRCGASCWIWTTACFISLTFASAWSAADVPSKAAAVREDDAATRDAVTKGLKWLADARDQQAQLPRDKRSGYSSEVSAASFAGLAFLAGGSEPHKGPYQRQLRDCVAFVLENQDKGSGLFATNASQGPMYGHGYATLFLADVFLKTHDASLKTPLDRAVALIEKSASPEGGWRYLPQPRDADISVTACELNALLAAREAGIHVADKTIRDAVEYVHKCQNPDGGFSYMAGQGVGSGFPRTAAAIAVLLHAGAKPADKDVSRGMQYALEQLAQGKNSVAAGHYYYGTYYASQWLSSAPDGAKAWDALRRELVKSQKADGSWAGEFDPQYASANALIVLQAPQEKLWMFGGQP